MSLAERMRYVKAQGWVDSFRAWAIAANISEKAINTYLTRADEDPKADMHMSAVVALAKAAGLSLTWFITGEGEPRPGAAGKSPLDEYLRARLREVRRRDLTLLAVADALKLDGALVRRLWGGGSIASHHEEYVSRALGFMSPDAMRGAAAEWWRTKGERILALAVAANDPNHDRAEAHMITRSDGATDQEILSTLDLEYETKGEGLERWLLRFMVDLKRARDYSDKRDARVERHARADLPKPKRPPAKPKKLAAKAPKSVRPSKLPAR